MHHRITAFAVALFIFLIPVFCQGQSVGLITKNNGEQDGYVLFSAPSTETYLIDKCGKLINKWNTKYSPGDDAYLLPNGNLLSTGTVGNMYFSNGASDGGLVQIYDWSGNLIWRHTFSDSIAQQDHDIYPMPNGNILVLEWDRHSAAASIAKGKDSVKLGGSEMWGVKVQEVKPVGSDSAQIVWEWRIWDHVVQDKDSAKPGYGIVSKHPELLNINYTDALEGIFSPTDWIHANSVTYNADLDQVMISSRSLSEIYIIDHSTTTSQAASHSGGNHNKGGDFLYRWGNPAAYNKGTKTNRTLYVQHNASWIPKGYPGAGNITIFNDGTSRPGGNYSTADIFAPPVDSKGNYTLDTSGMYGPATAYWSYKASNPTSFYSAVMGGVQRLPNGNMLICESLSGLFFEVDSNYNLVWKYVNPDEGNGPVNQGTAALNNPCYRANLYTSDYPAFKNKTLTPGSPIELKPYAYNCFMPYNLYFNPVYKIAQLKGYNTVSGVADSLNKGRGFIKGVVESQNLSATNIQFSLIDNTGAITVTANKLSYNPVIGDSLIVRGSVNQVNGLIVYAADTVLTKSTGSWLKQPDIVNKLSEANQSNLVEIKNVHLINLSEWSGKGNSFVVHITNGKDTFLMVISSKTDLFKSRPLTEEFNVIGIEIQNQTKAPFFGNYEIEPRGSFDISRDVQLYNIRQIRGENTITGEADSAGSRNNFYLKGILQSPDFVSKGYNFSLKDSTGSVIIQAASGVNGYIPEMGDSIEIRGLLSQVNGLIIVTPDSVSKLSNANPVLKPVIISSPSESTEAKLIKLRAVHLIDTTQWKPAGTGFTVDITNGTDTLGMIINSTVDLFKMNVLKGGFNLTGIEIQNQPNAPYLGKYQVEPRGFIDIERYTALYHINQVRTQNPVSGIADSAGNSHPFFLKGIVQSPDLTSSGLNFSIRDNTGSIIVFSSAAVSGYVPVVGDSIQLRGLIIQNNGLTEIIPDSISVLKNASPMVLPELVSTLAEQTEAHLVKLRNYRLLDQGQWKPAGNGFTVNITDGKDTLNMYISNTTDLYKMKAPIELFNVTGIEIQSKISYPYIGNYEIEPRGSFDLQHVTQLYSIRNIRTQNHATGIADSSGNKYPFFLKCLVQSQNLTGSGYLFSIKDSTGSIIVFSASTVSGYKPSIGDSIELRGLVMQYNGLTTISPDSVSLLKNIPSVINAITVSVLSENYEAQLIKLNNYHIVDPKQWIQKGSGFLVAITNGKDTISMLVSNTVDLYKMKVPNELFNITGIEIQNKPAAPYFGNYEIEPRGSFDIQRVVPLYTISQVRIQDPVSGIADSAGSRYNFYLEGIVQSPDFVNTGYEFSLKDATGSIFALANQKSGNYSPSIGDSVRLRGVLIQVNGLTAIMIDSVMQLTNTAAKLIPAVINTLSESNEGELVKLYGAWLIDPATWLPAGNGFNTMATNGKDTIQLYISSSTTAFSMQAPSGKFNITGIVYQDKSSSPYIGSYSLLPRMVSDFQFLKYPLYKIRQVKGYNAATGIADSINASCLLKGIVESPNLSGDHTLSYAIEDSTGAITIASDQVVNSYIPVPGDSIETRGIVKQTNGLTYFAIDSISKLTTATQIAPASIISLNEKSESELVKLSGYTLLNGSIWDTTAAVKSFEVKAHKGNDTITIAIVRGTDLFSNTTKPNYNFDITGISSQYDANSPYLSGYYIIPRSISDINHSSGILSQNESSGYIDMFPNPTSGSVTISTGNTTIDEIQITDIIGRVVFTEMTLKSGSIHLDVSSLNKGVYFVKLSAGVYSETVKLIKQ